MKLSLISLVFCLLIAACSKKGTISNEMKDIPESGWAYNAVPDFVFGIQKPQIYHNIYLKLRVKKNYPYENLYLLAHLKDADGKEKSQKVNFTLTDVSGKPMGDISGDHIDYELPIFVDYKPSAGAGAYFIALEQNMRDSVLRGIESVGIKVMEGEPIF